MVKDLRVLCYVMNTFNNLKSIYYCALLYRLNSAVYSFNYFYKGNNIRLIKIGNCFVIVYIIHFIYGFWLIRINIEMQNLQVE